MSAFTMQLPMTKKKGVLLVGWFIGSLVSWLAGVVFAMLRLEPDRALCMLGKYLATELHPQTC